MLYFPIIDILLDLISKMRFRSMLVSQLFEVFMVIHMNEYSGI